MRFFSKFKIQMKVNFILDVTEKINEFKNILYSTMCGRFALNRALGQLRANINVRRVNTNNRTFTPSNNIAPQSTVPTVMNQEINLLLWGIENMGNTNPFFRCEGITKTRPDDIKERRCVVPVDGYFEWCKAHGQNQPYFFSNKNGDLLFLAAVYTASGRFALLTRDASNQVKNVHDRMPVIISLAQIPIWESNNWRDMLQENPPSLNFFPVSRMALRPGYNGPECVTEIKVKKQSGITDFLQKKNKEKIEEVLK